MPLAYKHGVRVKKRTAALSHLENCALATQADIGYPAVVVVTSINDGRHSQEPRSRHYTDEAIDIRTKGRPGGMRSNERKHGFVARMRERAGSGFYVALHDAGTPNEHIHAQVRKGETYP